MRRGSYYSSLKEPTGLIYKDLIIMDYSWPQLGNSVLRLKYTLSLQSNSVLFERLSETGSEYVKQTKEHVNEYADAGLRTMVLAYRELDEDEYSEFNEAFMAAKNIVSADRDEEIEAVEERIEKDLILLGATAVEDKLQNGVRT